MLILPEHCKFLFFTCLLYTCYLLLFVYSEEKKEKKVNRDNVM